MTYSIKHIGGVFTKDGLPIANQEWIKNIIWDSQNPYSRQGIENWNPKNGNEFQVELSGRWEKETLKTWASPDEKESTWRCNECCNGDRCDDPTHYYRKNCPYCKGTGKLLSNEVMLFIEATSTEDCSGEEFARLAFEDTPFKIPGTETREDYPIIKQGEKEPDYVPYGEAWRREMRKFTKEGLIDFIARQGKEREVLETARSQEELYFKLTTRFSGGEDSLAVDYFKDLTELTDECWRMGDKGIPVIEKCERVSKKEYDENWRPI